MDNKNDNGGYSYGSQDGQQNHYSIPQDPPVQQPVESQAPYQQPYGNPQGQPPYVPPQPLPYGQMPYGQQISADPPGSKNATISMICGILSVVLNCTAIGSLILAIVALVQSQKAKSFGFTGGQATAGMILGILGIVFSVFWLFYWIILIFAIIIPASYSYY